jgi:hypothetical protein
MKSAYKKKWLKAIDKCLKQEKYFEGSEECALCDATYHADCGGCVCLEYGSSLHCYSIVRSSVHKQALNRFEHPINVRMHLRRMRKWLVAQ